MDAIGIGSINGKNDQTNRKVNEQDYDTKRVVQAEYEEDDRDAGVNQIQIKIVAFFVFLKRVVLMIEVAFDLVEKHQRDKQDQEGLIEE